MTSLEAALVDATGFLEDLRVPHMVIGGFANLYWGHPRMTVDLDIKIHVPESEWGEFLERIAGRFRILVPDPLGFARDTFVVPVEARSGVRVDFIFAGLPYEEEAIRRAHGIDVAGRTVRMIAPEDLILHKIISERSRDRDDIRGIVLRSGASLDLDYLKRHVAVLSSSLERDEIAAFFDRCLDEAGLGTQRPESGSDG